MPRLGTGGSATGKLWRMFWHRPGSAIYRPIGNVRNVAPATDGSITREEDSGNRTPFIKQGSVRPNVRFTFDVVRTNYITENCIITNNGDVPLHSLVWYDGQEYFDLSGLADTCRLSTNPAGMLQCAVVVKGRAIHPKVAWSGATSGWNEDPLTHEDVAQFTVQASGWTNWDRLEFGVNNQVDQTPLGTDILPSEVYEKAARHTGNYRISRRWAPTKFDESQQGTVQMMVIGITDKQAVPVTTTFTYSGTIIRNASVEDRDLEMVWESGDWEAENVNIA